MSRDDILALLRRFKQERAHQYDVTEIGIFGSAARGTFGEESDIDIVFKSDRPNLFRTSRMKQELRELLGRPVDVVRLRTRMNPRLKVCIEREACYV